MGKAKKRPRKHKGKSDRILARGENRNIDAVAELKKNPFELRLNRQKRAVLGRKTPKSAKGVPALARSKAVKKRKHTLLAEYKVRDKANLFIDRRFGENDTNMTLEDKMARRFAIENQRRHNSRKTRFNLNDNSPHTITHLGKSLGSGGALDDFIRDSDDDDDAGILGASHVEEQFGGLLAKKEDEISYKDRMLDVIAESKREKREKQLERDRTLNLTESLDDEWKQVRLIMPSAVPPDADDDKKAAGDSYDQAVRSLQFDRKIQPGDAVKSKQKLDEEEQARLKRLKEDKIQRMLPPQASIGKGKKASNRLHMSADALEEDFDILYQADDDDEKLKDTEKNDTSGSEEEADDDDVSDDNASADDDSEDFTDDDGDSEKADADDISTEEESSTQVADVLDDTTEAKIEPMKNKVPLTVSKIESLLSNLPIDTRVKRAEMWTDTALKACKADIQAFFESLLQYSLNCADSQPPDIDFINRLVKCFYRLCSASPDPTSRSVLNLLKSQENRCISLLLLFRLIGKLYPTSDYHHPVTTPAMLKMCLLLQSPVKDLTTITSGLFLCDTIAHYISVSGRYTPPVISFLWTVLFLGANSKPTEANPPLLSRKLPLYTLCVQTDCTSSQLEIFPIQRLLTDCFDGLLTSSVKQQNVYSADDLTSEASADKKRCCLINTAVMILIKLVSAWKTLDNFYEIFKPIQVCLNALPVQFFCPQLKQSVEELVENIKISNVTERLPLRFDTIVKPVKRSLNPRLESNFDPTRKKRKRGGKTDITRRLEHKRKREYAGALREIRRDNAFLARHKLEENITRDTERNRKVKQIYASLAQQEGEVKAFHRGAPRNRGFKR